MNTGIKSYIIASLVKIATIKSAEMSDAEYDRATSVNPANYQDAYNYDMAHMSPTDPGGGTAEHLNAMNRYSRRNQNTTVADKRQALESQTAIARQNNIRTDADKAYGQYVEGDSAKSRSNVNWSQARDLFARAKANYMSGNMTRDQYRAALMEAKNFADANNVKYKPESFYRQYNYNAMTGRADRPTPAPPVPGAASRPQQQRGPARSILTSSTVAPQQTPQREGARFDHGYTQRSPSEPLPDSRLKSSPATAQSSSAPTINAATLRSNFKNLKNQYSQGNLDQQAYRTQLSQLAQQATDNGIKFTQENYNDQYYFDPKTGKSVYPTAISNSGPGNGFTLAPNRQSRPKPVEVPDVLPDTSVPLNSYTGAPQESSRGWQPVHATTPQSSQPLPAPLPNSGWKPVHRNY